MQQTNNTYIGVDIAKTNFVADLSGRHTTFAQNAQGIKQFIRELPADACVVCEATGGYEQTLMRALHAAGISAAVLMPKRVRFYAKSLGLLAKSDPLDARLLSRYARANAETMRLFQERPQNEDQLRELLRARDGLIEQIKNETNHAEHPGGIALLARQASSRRRMFEEQLEQIEAAIEKLVASDQSLRQRSERIRQIQGVGKVCAWTVLAELPEFGTLKKGQAACLVGLAPFCQDSGQKNASRHISGGRPRPRRVFYMAAISAARCNPVLREFYQRLRARGKPAKIALVAVMRKLAELINHALKYPDFSLAR